ncbi:MAG TPA: hypothetical protein VEJ87_05790 [Acidimicrobiales bacterium]|nr:hypothetical protein [Acidimicrobiales bacterium]
MKSLATNAPVAIISVASVLVLIITHEVLAAIAGDSDRFVLTRRWLSRLFSVLFVAVAFLIIIRFYYLRTS